MASQVEKILILAKTYPSPSAQHVETSCYEIQSQLFSDPKRRR